MSMLKQFIVTAAVLAAAVSFAAPADQAARPWHRQRQAQLGPRPFFLVDDMPKSRLQRTLKECAEGPFYKTDFSIGHRGAALQFPEHTKESYEAAARMGAGIVECDVTFTKDKQLVCRHSQCDLETTTNILATPLASKCSIQPDPASAAPYKNVKCCTSDITFREFKMLKGKMDAGNRNARTLAEFMDATPNFRTDLYAANGTVMSHRESIQLFKKLGVKMTPELKAPSVPMPFKGLTQEAYAQKMINEYKAAGVKPGDVFPQSFNIDDIRYWLAHEPRFGRQAVYLQDLNAPEDLPAAIARLPALAAEGVQIVAPPMWVLVTLDQNNKIVPSEYALAAKAAGLDIITWTLERSGLLKNIAGDPYYYQSVLNAVKTDGDVMTMLDVLAQDVGILGIFSDWPATVTFYANCMNLK